MDAALTRRTCLFATAIGATLLAAGCAPDLDEAAQAEATGFTGEGVAVPEDFIRYEDVAIAEGMGSAQGEDEFPRTVVHLAGTTEIAARPVRVVTVSGGQLDAALSLGILPIGSSNAQDAATVPDYLVDAVKALGGSVDAIGAIGQRSEPSLEAIAALEPDLILGNVSGLEEIYEDLAAIAPTVLTEGNPDRWRQDYLLLGAALGLQEAAAANLSDLADRAAEVAASTEPSSLTVSLIRLQEDRIRSMGCAATAGMAMAQIGFLRPATAPADAVSEDVSLENITDADGDLVLYGSLGGEDPASDGGGEDAVPAELERLSSASMTHVDDEIWFQNAGVLATRRIIEQTAGVLAARG